MDLKKLSITLGIVVLLVFSAFALTACNEQPQVVSPVTEVEVITPPVVTPVVEPTPVVEDTTPYSQADLDAEYDIGYVDGQTFVPEDTTIVEEPISEVIDKYSKSYELGDQVATSLDDNEISKLYDGSIEFDGDKVDTEEILELTSDIEIAYSGNGDEDFGSDIYLISDARDSIRYTYKFNDEVDIEDVDTNSPLDINFLGQEMSIVDVEVDGMTFFTQPYVFVNVGETVLNTHVKLVEVSEDSVMVEVGTEKEVINEGQTEEVNGVSIYVDSVFYRNTREQSSAMLIVGEGAEQTVESGDYFDDAEKWQWVITTDGNHLDSISLVLDEKFNKLDTEDSEVSALGINQCIVLPEEYLSVCLDGTNEPSYLDLEMRFDDIDVSGVDIKVMELSLTDDKFLVSGDNYKVVYTDGANVYVKDGNDYISLGASSIVVEMSDADYSVFYDNLNIWVVDEDLNSIYVEVDYANQILGLSEEDAELWDVSYEGTGIGTRDNDVLTVFGVVVKDPESNADNDEVVLSLPSEKLEAEISFF